jgi:hypothetical protein
MILNWSASKTRSGLVPGICDNEWVAGWTTPGSSLSLCSRQDAIFRELAWVIMLGDWLVDFLILWLLMHHSCLFDCLGWGIWQMEKFAAAG